MLSDWQATPLFVIRAKFSEAIHNFHAMLYRIPLIDTSTMLQSLVLSVSHAHI